jgi:hypothetical protein
MILLVVLLVASGLVVSPRAVAAPGPTQQRQLVPAYFRPTVARDLTNPWLAMCSRMSRLGNGSIAIMNPSSGPGTARDTLYARAISDCQSRRQRVVGYLATDYGARSLAQVRADIDTYYHLYPSINGIFVDEMSNCEVCILQNGMSIPVYYSRIRSYVKQKSSTLGVVVGNPGAAARSNWQVDSTPVADIVVVFEGSRSSHASWTPPAWVLSTPYSKLSQMVYGVTGANRPAVCNKTRSTNAGYIYVTDDVPPNPWDRLPSYWTSVAPACT